MSDLHVEVTSTLWLARALALLGLGPVLWVRILRARALGRPLHVQRDSAGVKPALFAAQLALFALCWTLPEEYRGQALLALAGAALLTWCTPGAGDEALGSAGVVRGWFGRRFAQLEEWRLTGDHLRFRLRGEWTAVHVPSEHRAALREVLERDVPQLESRLRH